MCIQRRAGHCLPLAALCLVLTQFYSLPAGAVTAQDPHIEPEQLTPILSKHTDPHGVAHVVLYFRVIYSDGVAMLAAPDSERLREIVEQFRETALEELRAESELKSTQREYLHLAARIETARFHRLVRQVSGEVRKFEYNPAGIAEANALIRPISERCNRGIFSKPSLVQRVFHHLLELE